MSFVDTIKKSVLAEFTGTISVTSMVISLLVAFAISVYIIFIYKKTFSGVVFSKSFALSLILLSMVTTMIILTINSNLSLSLGMVGALSIVRFRTAVKEPVDTIFMFWAISVGIMSGAGLYLVAIVASLILGILFSLSFMFGFKKNSKYLFIIKYDERINSTIEKALKKIKDYKVKSKNVSKGKIELSFEVNLQTNKTELLDAFNKIDGVESASLISYQNDFGA